MQHFLNTIIAIIGDAEAIPRSLFRKGVEVESKADASPVTKADRATERLIRDALAHHFPDHDVFGEEFGHDDTASPFLWVIDPIDGTRSFISGMPLYSMLAALLHEGEPVLGVVHIPELAETYSGSASGAFLNGLQRLQTSGEESLADAFLYLNEADKILAAAPQVFHRLNAAGRDRRYCYDGYPHMLVAAGHADACIDYDLKPYDYLALVPLIRAAGGVISDWQGQPLRLHSDGRVLSAATPALHRALLDVLQEG